jgi:UDP-N-acetyl-D-mannosaminuronic acid dehydrogenase
MICDRLGIDVWELIRLANRHPRVKVLQPGPGVGGHCIAVDPWFIVDAAPDLAHLIATARSVNDSKPVWVLEKIVDAARGIKDPVIACLGLSFKPNVDDLRESPAVEIVRALAGRGVGRVLAVEPNIRTLPPLLRESGIELVTVDEALSQAQVVVVLVDHKSFAGIGPAQISGKVLVDTRGLFQARRPPQ